MIFGGGTPLDFGKKFRGKPIFGKHKTIRGTVSGIASGIIVAYAESLLFGFGWLLYAGMAMSVGTLLGDLAGSFIKRRIGMKEGHSLALLDQYPFLVFALAAAYPFGHTPGVFGVLFLLILTGVMHKLTNALAYMAKLKSVPW